MKKIIVTPAGRKIYLELLYTNLYKCKDEFDYWVIWVNTTNQNDIDYMRELEKNCDWIHLQYSEIDIQGISSIYHFFKKCIDVDAVYIRLDDDIVYIHKNSLKDLFAYRIKNKEPFLIYGNIFNNAITSYIYQRNMRLNRDTILGYHCTDDISWKTPEFAEKIHNCFLSKIEKNEVEDFFIHDWILCNYERCSINVISWLGETFKTFDGNVGKDEEQWLSCIKPAEIKSPNVIFGHSLFVHFAFTPQRHYLHTTNILSRYSKILGKN